MIRFLKRKVKVVDSSDIEFVGVQYLENPFMQYFRYDENDYTEIKNVRSPEEVAKFLDGDKTLWFNIHGIHDSELINKISSLIGVHSLLIKDLMDTSRLSRVQDFEKHEYYTIKSILFEGEGMEITTEQISFILGNNYLFSFQEKKGDHFEHIRGRIREKIGRVRLKGPDYLLYLLLEAIVDNYYITIKKIEKSIEDALIFEREISVKAEELAVIENLKSKVDQIRKNLQPVLDSLSMVEKGFSDIIEKDNLKYFAALRDTCLFLSAELDSDLQKLESGANMYFSLQNQNMNQIMKTLTIVTVIFIPLSFIAGVYGMNFDYMPELKWDHGYFLALGLMLTISLSLIMFFRARGWFK